MTCPEDEKERIRRDLRAASLVSWTLILSGWMSAFTALFTPDLRPASARPLLGFLGWLLCVAGTVGYVRLRRRGWAWSLVGLTGWLAPFLLSELATRCRYCGDLDPESGLHCKGCDAPLL
jgi:hypothetical protein